MSFGPAALIVCAKKTSYVPKKEAWKACGSDLHSVT